MECFLVKFSSYESYEFIEWIEFIAKSGVPKCSHLDPNLFAIHMFMILLQVARLSAHCLMFTEDIKIFSEIRNVEDAVSLQKNLVLKLLNTGVWWTKWCLPVKSVLLFPAPDHCHRYLSLSSFSLIGQRLVRKYDVKDFGVYPLYLFVSWKSWKASFVVVTARARRMLGFIFRCSRLLLHS